MEMDDGDGDGGMEKKANIGVIKGHRKRGVDYGEKGYHVNRLSKMISNSLDLNNNNNNNSRWQQYDDIPRRPRTIGLAEICRIPPYFDLGDEAYETAKKNGELSGLMDYRWHFSQDGLVRIENLSEVCPDRDLHEIYLELINRYATIALEFFNKTNDKGVEYEMVKPLNSIPMRRVRHGNFLAKLKNTDPSDSESGSSPRPKLFYYETPTGPTGGKYTIVKCCTLDPNPQLADPEYPDCESWKIYHPTNEYCHRCLM